MPFRNIRNPRPCQRCRKLHIRCIASPNSESCQKCLRHKWDCVPVNPLRSMPRSVRKQQSSVPKAAVPAAPSPSSSSSCSTPDTVHSDLSSSPSVAPLYPEWQAHYERDSSHHLQFPSFSSSPEYLEPSNLREARGFLKAPPLRDLTPLTFAHFITTCCHRRFLASCSSRSAPKHQSRLRNSRRATIAMLKNIQHILSTPQELFIHLVTLLARLTQLREIVLYVSASTLHLANVSAPPTRTAAVRWVDSPESTVTTPAEVTLTSAYLLSVENLGYHHSYPLPSSNPHCIAVSLLLGYFVSRLHNAIASVV
ncbi:hypothetical protein BDV98DRAFT_603626 [Pterulicium gracile]|uniref:Zn(2)-C6 fungal-type domain-containing protein n=1 Tax=Pterulicium gracile TaxID=1884261 RepID=A0A5C3QM52_9AGAR|nr:hypothetical protein BDV98DRAFT_603626 [Pterula gracilis]